MPTAVLITGSRRSKANAKVLMELSPFKDQDALVIHGGASGIDSIADYVCKKQLFLPVLTVPANWSKLLKMAGPARNRAMVRMLMRFRDFGYECHVIAFPAPDSTGTLDCIRVAKEEGFEVKIVPVL